MERCIGIDPGILLALPIRASGGGNGAMRIEGLILSLEWLGYLHASTRAKSSTQVMESTENASSANDSCRVCSYR
jgi:hypothetical protein